MVKQTSPYFVDLTTKLDFAIWPENSILHIWQKKIDFSVLPEIFFFLVLAGNSILRFWQECLICGFGGKTRFSDFDGKTHGKIRFCGLTGKLDFGVLARKSILWFWRENSNFLASPGKLNFWFKLENSILQFRWENAVLRFEQRNSFLRFW